MTRKQLEKLSNDDLDEIIFDIKANEASAINAGGREEQIDFIIEE